MKILAIHSIFGENDKTKSAVDTWRIWRPLRELKKHVDWQIDEQPSLIKGIEKYASAKEFTEEEMRKAYIHLSKYDIVFSSYHADPTGYSMLKVLEEKYGVQFVMDIDDDMFSVNPDNPFWVKIDDEKCYWMQCMIRDNTWISTTTPELAKVFRDRRDRPEDSVFINPNFITDDYKQNPFNNGDKIVIGYFGGSSHYSDIHDTGVMEAVQKIMHERKDVYFKAVGMPVDTYLPRKRYTFVDGKRFNGWMNEIYPNLAMDIALAPLKHDIFNKGKSNIKWQESTRAGALFVGSNYGPYSDLDGKAILVDENTQDAWYSALKQAIDDVELRKGMIKTAQEDLKANWRLEDNWKRYKTMFETVYRSKHENNPTITK
jgi:glycosyltransferase involved in cell wall biosynthesis